MFLITVHMLDDQENGQWAVVQVPDALVQDVENKCSLKNVLGFILPYTIIHISVELVKGNLTLSLPIIKTLFPDVPKPQSRESKYQV